MLLVLQLLNCLHPYSSCRSNLKCRSRLTFSLTTIILIYFVTPILTDISGGDVIVLGITRFERLTFFCGSKDQESECHSPNIPTEPIPVFSDKLTSLRLFGVLVLNNEEEGKGMFTLNSNFNFSLRISFAAGVSLASGASCDEHRVTPPFISTYITFFSSSLVVKANQTKSNVKNTNVSIGVKVLPFVAAIDVTLPLISPPLGDKKLPFENFYQLCVKKRFEVATSSNNLPFNSSDSPVIRWTFSEPYPWLRLMAFKSRSRYLLPYISLQISLIVAMFLISGLFSGLTIGLLSLDPTELTLIQKSGTPKERAYSRIIAPLRKRGNFLLCSLVLGNVLVNSTLTILLENLSSGKIAVIVSTFGITIFGEILPQAICTRYGLAIGARTVWLTRIIMGLTSPVSYPVSRCLDAVLGEEIGSVYDRQRLLELVKMMAATPCNSVQSDISNGSVINKANPPIFNRKKGGSLVDASTKNSSLSPHKRASLKPPKNNRSSNKNKPNSKSTRFKSEGDLAALRKDEADIIAGALAMNSKKVGEIMTPLERVFAIPYSSILDFETLASIVASGYTRIPVYNEPDKSNILGLLNFKDLAFVDPDDRIPLSTVLKFYKHFVTYVYEDTLLTSILDEFKKGKSHMAFVRRVIIEEDKDPWYRIVGLVTLEDVIEEIIQSEIWDETDNLDKIDNKGSHVRKREHDFDLFWRPDDPNKDANYSSLLTPQMSLVAYQYLKANIDAFGDTLVSGPVLRKLIRRPSVVMNFPQRNFDIRKISDAPIHLDNIGHSTSPTTDINLIKSADGNVLHSEEHKDIGKVIATLDNNQIELNPVKSSSYILNDLKYSSCLSLLGNVSPCHKYFESSLKNVEEHNLLGSHDNFIKIANIGNALYTKGKPADYFIMILEGRVRVYAGSENICFDTGPFSYFGLQALTLNDDQLLNNKSKKSTRFVDDPHSLYSSHRNNEEDHYHKSKKILSPENHHFIPDFTVIPLYESNQVGSGPASNRLIYLKIRTDHYRAVCKATAIEREMCKAVKNIKDTNSNDEHLKVKVIDELINKNDKGFVDDLKGRQDIILLSGPDGGRHKEENCIEEKIENLYSNKETSNNQEPPDTYTLVSPHVSKGGIQY
ncbi:unnamed protein product [Gordionus sp. m RMFG-2023]|uniref:uncharacterized protein LOC135925105 isoform X3 n=1 Tax=Gordionus sp. m RMFG-2023 TaxID=3053472 RepID=UPI0030E2D51D